MKTICPRCGKEPAIIDPSIGVLPGKKCQTDDEKINIKEHPEFYTLGKQHRIQQQRDSHNADTLQPWIGKDNKPNPDFVRKYPEKAKDYFSSEQLKKM